MKQIFSKRGTGFFQIIMLIMVLLSAGTLYGQKYNNIMEGNLTWGTQDYQGPQWDTSANPYQFLQELYQEHGFTVNSVVDDCEFSDNPGLFQDVASAFSVPTWALKGVSTVGEIITRAMIIHHSNSTSEESDYRKIEYSSNPMDFRNYISRYPESDYYDIVKEKMYATRIAQLWQMAELLDRKVYYENCLQAYEFFSKWYCEELLGEGYEEDCHLHYFRYEGFDHIILCQIAKKTRERLGEFDAQSKEKEAEWKGICDSNRYSAYIAYRKQYLGSALADSALIRAKQFEEADYQQAVQANTRAAFDGFLHKYPYGYYAPRVAGNIIDLFQAEHHAVPDNISPVAAYEQNRPLYARIGIVNADKENRTYTVTVAGEEGSQAVLRPSETVWLELPAARDYEILVKSDNGDYRFSTLYFNACGYILYLHGKSPEWGYHSYFDETIVSKADTRSIEKLIQEAESMCGKRISFSFE